MVKKKAEEKKTKIDENAELTFTKSQLVNSRKYQDKRDALNALFEDEKTYSFPEVDKIIKRFYEG